MVKAVVLSIGSDRVLLDTRNRILRAAGYIVVDALSVQEAIGRFPGGDFDVVLMCHSVPQADRERLAFLVRKLSLRTPIILISGAPGQVDRFADATLQNDPETFLAGLRQLIDGARVRDASKPLPQSAPPSR